MYNDLNPLPENSNLWIGIAVMLGDDGLHRLRQPVSLGQRVYPPGAASLMAPATSPSITMS